MIKIIKNHLHIFNPFGYDEHLENYIDYNYLGYYTIQYKLNKNIFKILIIIFKILQYIRKSAAIDLIKNNLLIAYGLIISLSIISIISIWTGLFLTILIGFYKLIGINHIKINILYHNIYNRYYYNNESNVINSLLP